MSIEIPQTQKAVQLTGPDELILNTEKAVYRPGPYQILCKIEAPKNERKLEDVSKMENTTTISKKKTVQNTSKESFFDNQKLFDFISE